ncbi:MAG: zinc-dependent metalloprotease [Chloroflexi bacterium]|nr:zinc-dependent metalloprotease [Chloroflexota bacterium]
MTGQAAGLAARATRAGLWRAAAVGAALGVGLVAQRMARRRLGDDPSLVDWATAESIAATRLRRAPGALRTAELTAAGPAYAAIMTRIVPLLEARLGQPLPGVVERHAVVDRAGWAAANIGAFRDLIGHLETSALGARAAESASVARVANRYIATRQVGLLLSWLGTRVLGQYDIALLSAEEAPGRLLFVEENIRGTARSLGIPLDRFRTWIALHEATHAFELEAHPWLRPYLRERLERQIDGFLGEAKQLQARGMRHLIERWRSAAAEGSIVGFMSPEQRGLLREVQLVMSLLEGFSDWVMDDVGEQVLPDVASIRRRFEQRRDQRRTGIDRIVARLTGMDMKLEQYRRGERFVAGVYAAGGERAIAHIWDGPAALPTDAEMADPVAWVRRVVPDALTDGPRGVRAEVSGDGVTSSSPAVTDPGATP